MYTALTISSACFQLWFDTNTQRCMYMYMYMCMHLYSDQDMVCVCVHDHVCILIISDTGLGKGAPEIGNDCLFLVKHLHVHMYSVIHVRQRGFTIAVAKYVVQSVTLSSCTVFILVHADWVYFSTYRLTMSQLQSLLVISIAEALARSWCASMSVKLVNSCQLVYTISFTCVVLCSFKYHHAYWEWVLCRQ